MADNQDEAAGGRPAQACSPPTHVREEDLRSVMQFPQVAKYHAKDAAAVLTILLKAGLATPDTLVHEFVIALQFNKEGLPIRKLTLGSSPRAQRVIPTEIGQLDALHTLTLNGCFSLSTILPKLRDIRIACMTHDPTYVDNAMSPLTSGSAPNLESVSLHTFQASGIVSNLVANVGRLKSTLQEISLIFHSVGFNEDQLETLLFDVTQTHPNISRLHLIGRSTISFQKIAKRLEGGANLGLKLLSILCSDPEIGNLIKDDSERNAIQSILES